MTERTARRREHADCERPPARWRGSPARGILIGLAIATPCWLAIGYVVHLLIGRL